MGKSNMKRNAKELKIIAKLVISPRNSKVSIGPFHFLCIRNVLQCPYLIVLFDGNDCTNYSKDVENKHGRNRKSHSISTSWKRQLAWGKAI